MLRFRALLEGGKEYHSPHFVRGCFEFDSQPEATPPGLETSGWRDMNYDSDTGL